MNRLAFAAALALAASVAGAQQIDTVNFDQTMTLDPVGNATGTIKFALSARQYGQWQEKYGTNPSLLKRDMGRVLSQYETSDWSVKPNQMEREIVVSFRAKGPVIYRGGGLFEYRVPKNWRSGGVTGQTVNYSYVEPLAGNSLASYAIHIVTPDGATGISESTGDSGEQVVQYKLPVASYRQTWMPVTGALVALLGFGVVATGFVGRTKKVAPSEPAPTV